MHLLIINSLLLSFAFLAGLGLREIMPNIAALVTDYAPKKMKIKLVSLLSLVFFVFEEALT